MQGFLQGDSGIGTEDWGDDSKMQEAFGDDWMETVTEMKQNYTKKKLREAKHSVLVEEE